MLGYLFSPWVAAMFAYARNSPRFQLCLRRPPFTGHNMVIPCPDFSDRGIRRQTRRRARPKPTSGDALRCVGADWSGPTGLALRH